MSRLITIIFLYFFVISSSMNNPALAQERVRKYNYEDFTRLEVGYGMHLAVKQSGTFGISVKADEDDFKRLRVEKKGTTIKFSMEKSFFHPRTGDIYIIVSMPLLNSLSLSGGSTAELSMNSPSNSFSADLSGGSRLKGNFTCADVSFELSGGSRVILSGKGNNLKADGSGGSLFNLKDFLVKNVNVSLSGGSEATLNMNGKLNTHQSGGSKVTYYGKAVLGNTSFSGGSSIRSGN